MLPISLQVISEEINKTIKNCDMDSISDMKNTINSISDMFYDYETYTEYLERCLMDFIGSSYCKKLEKADAQTIIDEYCQKITGYELTYNHSSGMSKMIVDLFFKKTSDELINKEREGLQQKEKEVLDYLKKNLNIKK